MSSAHSHYQGFVTAHSHLQVFVKTQILGPGGYEGTTAQRNCSPSRLSPGNVIITLQKCTYIRKEKSCVLFKNLYCKDAAQGNWPGSADRPNVILNDNFVWEKIIGERKNLDFSILLCQYRPVFSYLCAALLRVEMRKIFGSRL